jgi:hypothetical protein
MNIKMLKMAFAGLVLGFSGFANAGLIQGNYLSVNDNNTVIDTETSLEWLDISVSSGWSFANWESLVQGSGWRLASIAEVHNLFDTLFPRYDIVHPGAIFADTTDSELVSNFKMFQELFGVHEFRNNGLINTYGRYGSELVGDILMSGTSDFFGGTPRIFGKNFVFNVRELDEMGIYIVRDSVTVSEPASLFIFALGMIGLASRRFKINS